MSYEIEIQAKLCCISVVTILALGVGARIHEVSDDSDRHEGSSAVRIQGRADISTAGVSIVNVLPADSRCSYGGTSS